ncbi:MAG: hypothetical protein KDA85_19915 [Planctomycetaceae bacterium]|nr:hypothetical protein [Planctomycetaceae bacterium]
MQSDVPVQPDGPLVQELEFLQIQISDTLQLPEPRDRVHVYLFSDEASYRHYMHLTWPDLPPRRAYFVGTPRELAVYSFNSPQVLEDLRHEFTHGLLHANLLNVPLWLDEGLAEYFEVRGPLPGGPHNVHLQTLEQAQANNWHPNLFRLEMISDFRDLTQRDYAESWAWVHLCLNGNDSLKQTLLEYLAELQTRRNPRRLLPSVEAVAPDYSSLLLTHIDQMEQVRR